MDLADCAHEYLLAFACKRRRFCPSCHQKRVVEFGVWLCEEVLRAVPHRHCHPDLWGFPGLWEVKPRPPPKATGPTKVAEYNIDYSTFQLPASDEWRYVDPEPAHTCSYVHFTLDTQGEIPYTPAQKKRVLITSPSYHHVLGSSNMSS